MWTRPVGHVLSVALLFAASPSADALALRAASVSARRSAVAASPRMVLEHRESAAAPCGVALEGNATAAAALRPPHPLNVLWRFSRPHTMIGSALCIPSLTLFAMPATGAGAGMLSVYATAALYAMPAALLMNVYIVGLNQLFDIEIDKVNKPDLPLAAGDLRPAPGVAIVIGALLASLGLGWWHSTLSTTALRVTLVGSAVLGTAYSLPPLRLKRFPLLASLSIMTVQHSTLEPGAVSLATSPLTESRAAGCSAHLCAPTDFPQRCPRPMCPRAQVRGALINWGFFTHASAVAAKAASAATGAAAASVAMLPGTLFTSRCAGPVLFFTLFGTVIALVKDVPDVAGDAQFGYRSFSVRLGQATMLRLASAVLCLNYVGTAVALFTAALSAGAQMPLVAARRAVVGLAAAATARHLHRRVRTVAANDPDDVYAYYMDLWKAFYAAYAWLPLTR